MGYYKELDAAIESTETDESGKVLSANLLIYDEVGHVIGTRQGVQPEASKITDAEGNDHPYFKGGKK